MIINCQQLSDLTEEKKPLHSLILCIPDVIYNFFQAEDPRLTFISTMAIPTTLGMGNDRRRLLQPSLKEQKKPITSRFGFCE